MALQGPTVIIQLALYQLPFLELHLLEVGLVVPRKNPRSCHCGHHQASHTHGWLSVSTPAGGTTTPPPKGIPQDEGGFPAWPPKPRRCIKRRPTASSEDCSKYTHTLFQPWEWEIPSKYLLYQGLFGKSSTSMGNFPAIFDDRNGRLGPRKNQWPADCSCALRIYEGQTCLQCSPGR